MSLPYFNCLIVDKFPYCYSKLNRVKYSRAHLFEVDIIILHKNLRLEDNSALFYGYNDAKTLALKELKVA